jgi:hypothetical protein
VTECYPAATVQRHRDKSSESRQSTNPFIESFLWTARGSVSLGLLSDELLSQFSVCFHLKRHPTDDLRKSDAGQTTSTIIWSEASYTGVTSGMTVSSFGIIRTPKIVHIATVGSENKQIETDQEVVGFVSHDRVKIIISQRRKFSMYVLITGSRPIHLASGMIGIPTVASGP